VLYVPEASTVFTIQCIDIEDNAGLHKTHGSRKITALYLILHGM
jgi:hypothetical protein